MADKQECAQIDATVQIHHHSLCSSTRFSDLVAAIIGCGATVCALFLQVYAGCLFSEDVLYLRYIQQFFSVLEYLCLILILHKLVEGTDYKAPTTHAVIVFLGWLVASCILFGKQVIGVSFAVALNATGVMNSLAVAGLEGVDGLYLLSGILFYRLLTHTVTPKLSDAPVCAAFLIIALLRYLMAPLLLPLFCAEGFEAHLQYAYVRERSDYAFWLTLVAKPLSYGFYLLLIETILGAVIASAQQHVDAKVATRDEVEGAAPAEGWSLERLLVFACFVSAEFMLQGNFAAQIDEETGVDLEHLYELARGVSCAGMVIWVIFVFFRQRHHYPLGKVLERLFNLGGLVSVVLTAGAAFSIGCTIFGLWYERQPDSIVNKIFGSIGQPLYGVFLVTQMLTWRGAPEIFNRNRNLSAWCSVFHLACYIATMNMQHQRLSSAEAADGTLSSESWSFRLEQLTFWTSLNCHLLLWLRLQHPEHGAEEAMYDTIGNKPLRVDKNTRLL